MPHRKALALNWRRLKERYTLATNKCAACGEVFFPPRLVCPTCRRKGKLEPARVSGAGEVFSYTTVHVAPEGFEYGTPYVLAIIKLREGPLVTGQMTDVDPAEIKIGTLVRTEFRKIVEESEDGIIHYAYKFVKA